MRFLLLKQFALVTNILVTDLAKNEGIKNTLEMILDKHILTANFLHIIGEMTVNPALVETGVMTVSQVRDLLKSSQLYRNQAMYNLLCGGLESGKLKKREKRGKTTISDLLTGAHEAWIRLELHYNLQKQMARHKANKSHNTARTEEWQVFCGLVFQDREENEKQATLERAGIGDASDVQNDNEEDDDEDAVPACDPKFFQRKVQ